MKPNTLFATVLTASTLLAAAPAMADISYQHIRNATAKINYGGTTFLVDPYLAPKGAYAGFAGTVNSQLRHPLNALPQSTADIIKGVDAVVVTHTHEDHWDEAAQKMLPKDLLVFVQNTNDAKIIRAQGFKDVRVVGKNTEFKNVRLSKTGGQHGSDQMYANPQLAEMLGDAMGVVFQAQGEKTLYVVGDTLWNYHVDHALAKFKPEIIVMNTGYARIEGIPQGIIMGTADVSKAYQAAPNAQIITVHMDSVNHGTISSNDMRKYVKTNRLGSRVHVPSNGQVLKF
ncbi:MBL fold metallo-hydrolase [Neisseria iguanae]|uniref:Metallo-beta-lactamase domain-containing protein n=1 Tax=Neisseria iguanae TaxID=90242 RepID=A0A2P7TYV6_9NEIS|nr:MBL fold metallo-hydrolase [Neisseria iguanae]PSJ79914.1 hypothetical protein C7N83_09340 [Neisseria iguanae]